MYRIVYRGRSTHLSEPVSGLEVRTSSKPHTKAFRVADAELVPVPLGTSVVQVLSKRL